MRGNPQRRRRGLLLALALALLLAMPAAALDDDEFNGYAADTLTVKVGYFGGPYYEKHVFTLEELWAMDVVYADYTFIDSMPAVVIDHVAGVRLSDLLDAAGIDLNSVQTFYFWTRDKQNDYYTSYPKSALIDTPRYCYYSLPENFDSDLGEGNADATAIAERVDTVVALADDWNRCIAGATFGSDYLNLNTNTRFRLIFGQTDAVTQTASRSAKWIHEIVVELGGAPTLTMDESVLELEVGSVRRTSATVQAADPAIAAGAEIVWSSSDESVATVDGEGNITVHSEGTAVITAAFGGSTASVVVNGTPGEGQGAAAGETPPGGGSGETPAPEEPPESAPPEEPSQDPEPAGDPESAPPAAEEVVPADTPQSILPETAGTESQTGGVQNWRVYEMSETAVELPVIEEDNPLLAVTLWCTLGLFLASIVLRVIKYYYDTGEKPHAFHKSQ